jgi:hypothetical protein
MRREDGRSRGFGYVTLDSAQAAERCLAAPQVIDGRVVDLKRAVPEGGTELALKAANRLGTQGCVGPKRQQRASILSTPAPFPDPVDTASPMLTMMWPPAAAPQSYWASTEAMDNCENIPDYASLMSAGTSSPSWHSAVGAQRLLSTAPSPMEQLCQPECSPETPTNASVLSASAPEFVPKVADSADRASTENSQKPAERSALGDITNIQDQACLKMSEQVIVAAKKKVEPPPGLMQQDEVSLKPASIPCQPDEEISPTSQASTYDPLSPSQWSCSSPLFSTTPLAARFTAPAQTQKESSVTAPETRTMSTQTEQEEEVVEAGMSKTVEGSSISRGELLSLRPRKSECNLGMRTISR